ncbi:hypothetical protein [Rariglobus hedericola]|uniref:Uncharacterized protein n=1 Tax=Rariglobus hedericola TaxID=2597822 RepID=A0A556QPP5_9BACT|nr:hypothetical protein [Rariglobus hedericola]TSJ78618.1 hypothetical protein FPL22_04760 [Rariglobus hedericola]
MKITALLLSILLYTSSYGLEPPPPQPVLQIQPGTYLLVEQGQLNDQAISLAQSESIVIEVNPEGLVIIKEGDGKVSVIEKDESSFSVIRKTKGREGVWISTYIGSLSSTQPAVYHGHFVRICKTEHFHAFDRGSFMLILQEKK